MRTIKPGLLLNAVFHSDYNSNEFSITPVSAKILSGGEKWLRLEHTGADYENQHNI